MYNKTRYTLATSNCRIWSRILDILFCLIIIVSFECLIIFTCKYKINDNNFETWRYLLMSLIVIIINFAYFILIPFFCKKGTLFNILMKINIYNESGNFFLNMIKKETFMWIIHSMIILCISIFLCSLSPKIGIEFISNILIFSYSGKFNYLTCFSIIFNLLILFSCIFLLFIFVNTIFCNKKHTMIDKFSHTTMYNIKPVNSNINTKKQTSIEYENMPGIVSENGGVD